MFFMVDTLQKNKFLNTNGFWERLQICKNHAQSKIYCIFANRIYMIYCENERETSEKPFVKTSSCLILNCGDSHRTQYVKHIATKCNLIAIPRQNVLVLFFYFVVSLLCFYFLKRRHYYYTLLQTGAKLISIARYSCS